MAKTAKELLESNDDEEIKQAIRRNKDFQFKRRKFGDNLEALNNLDRAEVTEDFEDSPFADRKPLINEDEI